MYMSTETGIYMVLNSKKRKKSHGKEVCLQLRPETADGSCLPDAPG